MKKIVFEVEIEVADNINDDNEINEMVEKLNHSIVREVINNGITPDNSETHTTKVSVKNYLTGHMVQKEII